MTLRPGRPVWLLVAAIILLTLAAELARVARPDMAFLLYAAGRLLDGAELYRDVVEINPPLVIWLNLPIVALARAMHVSELRLYSLLAAGVLTVLLLYGARVARRYALTATPEVHSWFVLAAAVALLPLSRADFGQREHLVLGLMLPYLLLAVARLRGVAVPGVEAVAIGLLAALGFALKPHFLLVWLGLEGLQRWRSPVRRWRAGPESPTIAAALLLYVVAVFRLTPAYFEVVGVLGPVYARYLQAPLLELLFLAPGAALILFAGLAVVAFRRRLHEAPLVWTLCTAMVACFLAGTAQQKGLRYHFYPALALAFVLLVVLTVRTTELRGLSERIYARIARAVVVAVALVAVGGTAVTASGGSPAERWTRAGLDELVELVKARGGGRPLGVLSYHMESAFPLVSYAGVPLASRFHHLWIIPASYWDSLVAQGAIRYHSFAEMSPAERWLNDAVRDDLLAAEPRLLLVLRPARDVGPNGLRRIHYIRYFSRQPELDAFFNRYHLLRQVREFDVYERTDGARAAEGSPPSLEPGRLDVRGADGVRFALGDPEFAAGVAVFALALAVAALPRRKLGGSVAAGGSPISDSTG